MIEVWASAPDSQSHRFEEGDLACLQARMQLDDKPLFAVAASQRKHLVIGFDPLCVLQLVVSGHSLKMVSMLSNSNRLGEPPATAHHGTQVKIPAFLSSSKVAFRICPSARASSLTRGTFFRGRRRPTRSRAFLAGSPWCFGLLELGIAQDRCPSTDGALSDSIATSMPLVLQLAQMSDRRR